MNIAHSHGKHAFMHSDGYVADIIPDLIEIGADVLDSQVFCIDLEELGASCGPSMLPFRTVIAKHRSNIRCQVGLLN